MCSSGGHHNSYVEGHYLVFARKSYAFLFTIILRFTFNFLKIVIYLRRTISRKYPYVINWRYETP